MENVFDQNIAGVFAHLWRHDLVVAANITVPFEVLTVKD